MGAPEHTWLTTLWERHADDVYAYARRRVGPSAAPDVVADVFTIAVEHPERVPPDALPWLYRCAANVIANSRRAESRRAAIRATLSHHADACVDDPASLVSERDAFLAALAALSADDREALFLTTWEGLDARRAARAAGCSPGTFAVRLHRARRKLERALGEQRVTPIVSLGEIG
jgi:RNA polymerase sigma factor (sigma-70 family)